MNLPLVNIRVWMTRYITSTCWALGVLGNLINIYIFTRKGSFRNSCSLYLLAASIINVLSISWGFFQPLYNLDNIDPTTYSFMYCKLRLYIDHTLLMIGRSLIIFACADRYALCTGYVRFRLFCQPKIAIRMIIANILVWPVLTVHIAILEVYKRNKCIMSGSYVIIYGLYSTIAAGTLPPVLMTIFSVLTIRHRRELRIRLNTRGVNNRNNNTFTIMLLSQVIVYIITTSLYPAITLYRAVTAGQTKSTESLQIETFVNFISSAFLIYLNPASAFYVYFIASKGFRKECKIAFIYLYKRGTGRRDRVKPLGIQTHDAPHIIRNTRV